MITRGFNASNYIAALEEPDVSQEDLNLSEIASLTGNQRPAHATERHDVETRTQERELEILFGIAASELLLYRVLNTLIWVLGVMFVIAIGVTLFIVVEGGNSAAILTGLGAVADLALIVWIVRRATAAKKSLLDTEKAIDALETSLKRRREAGRQPAPTA